MKVSICIASMGRPSLMNTIVSIREAIAAAGERVETIVADDSPDAAAARLLKDEHDVVVLPVAACNVSLARNACLDHASGEWLLFVDDDEYVDRHWLSEHLGVALECSADVVMGPVYHVYPQGTASWFRKVDPLFQDWGWSQTGRVVGHGRTGNTLVRRDLVERHGLRFDPRYGRSGGEDHDFFKRLAAQGGKMVVTDRARAWETVPATRTTAAYIMRRSLRSGQTHAMVSLRDAGPLARAAFALDASAKLCVAALGGAAAAPFSRQALFRMGIKAATNYGKLVGLGGGRLRSSWD